MYLKRNALPYKNTLKIQRFLKGDRTGFKDLVSLKVLLKGNTILLPDLKQTILPQDFFPIRFCLLTKNDSLIRSKICIKFVPKDVIIEVCVIIETLKTLN